MPIARFQFPDGRIGRFEVPDGTTEEQAMQMIHEHVYSSPAASASPPVNTDPTKGMGTGEKVLAGIGKGFVDTGRGVQQLLNIGDQDALLKDIEESRRLDKPLTDTRGGFWGNIGGSIAATAPLMAIPGVNTLAGGAAVGAGMGALSPSLSDEETANNIGFGAAGGGAGVALGRMLPAAYNAFVSPFLAKGREKIAGGVLRDFAGDDMGALLAKLKNPESFVPGSIPSVAEVAMTPKMSTLQKAVRNLPEGKDAIIGQELQNNGARLAAIRSVAGDDAAIEAAKLARKEAADKLYGAAGKQQVTVSDDLASLLKNPDIISAGKAVGIPEGKISPYVTNKGVPLQDMVTGKPVKNAVDVDTLHKLKIALDDAANFQPQTALDKMQQGGMLSAKRKLLDYLDEASPDYKTARSTFEDMSKPINQMEIGQALKDKLVPALTENGLPTREKAAMFADAIRNQEALIKRTTGARNKALEDVMTPEQMSTISGISKDLERKANSLDLAATRGSDTASNLIADNMLKNIIGPIGMPDSWLSKAAGSAILNALPRRAVDIAVPSVEKKVQSLLAEALADPKKAAALMEQINKGGSIAKWLYPAMQSAGAQGMLKAN